MVFPFLLLAQAPLVVAPDDAAVLERHLQSWFEASWAPAVRSAWTEAEPVSQVTRLSVVRWGPDAVPHPRTCADFSRGDPTAFGMTQDEVDASRARLGPGWAHLPTGFTGPGVAGAFRRHPARFGAGEHFTVSVTHLPPGLSAERLFDAGAAQGCTLSKGSDAWLWSGDLLVRVNGPCHEVPSFNDWTLLVWDALPGWSGAPPPERIAYASCGRMGMRLRTRAEVEAEAR